MKWKHMGAVAVVMAVLVSTWVVAQTPKPVPVPPPAPSEDARIGKILDQNEKLLKNQEEILKALTALQQDVTVLKFRSH